MCACLQLARSCRIFDTMPDIVETASDRNLYEVSGWFSEKSNAHTFGWTKVFSTHLEKEKAI